MYSSSPAILPDLLSPGHFYTLANDVSAIQILPSVDGEVRLSPVSKLPQGAEVATCGKGFDLETIKVSCYGFFYYVFLKDFEEKGCFAGGIN